MERKFDNTKYVMCVVTEMEDPIKNFEENIPKYLDEDEFKSTLKNKITELALKRYMDREDKIKEKMNKIYGIAFGQCNLSLQSVFKGVPD